MWKMFFQAGCNTEQFFLRTIAECFDFCNRWLCLGQCTGLVKYNSICLCNCFQEFATFYRDIIQTCFPIAESTLIGIASFSAQEKSTISTASVFVTFRVIR